MTQLSRKVRLEDEGNATSLIYTDDDRSVQKIVFDNAGISLGEGTITVGDQIMLPNGTESSPSIAFTNSTGVGLYRSASNVLGFTTAGSERMTLTAAGVIELNTPGYFKSSLTNAIVPFVLCAAQQTIAAGTGGAINITSHYTDIAVDAGGDAFQLADGAVTGQLKKIMLSATAGGTGVVTSKFTGAATTLTFTNAGEYALLMWDGTDWIALELSSVVTLTHKPVIS